MDLVGNAELHGGNRMLISSKTWQCCRCGCFARATSMATVLVGANVSVSEMCVCVCVFGGKSIHGQLIITCNSS